MRTTVKTYQGDGFEVTFDVRRCIHAEACIHGHSKVFDRDRRPWIDPSQGSADEIAAVVHQCPTGALKLLRDGRSVEPEPRTNMIRIGPDGPAYATGKVEVRDHDNTVLLRDYRVAFCRCGLSSNKPLCDDAHFGKFTDPGSIGNPGTVVDDEVRGDVVFTAALNGPLLFEGAVEIVGEDGTRVTKTKGAICRCGASQNKPFCDGAHKTIGFTSHPSG